MRQECPTSRSYLAVTWLTKALERAAVSLETLPPRPLEAGIYRAVLQAPAAFILLASLGQCAFNGRAFIDHESAFAGKVTSFA